MRMRFQFGVGRKKYEVVVWVDQGRCTHAAKEPASMGVDVAFAEVEPNTLAAAFDHIADQLRHMNGEVKP